MQQRRADRMSEKQLKTAVDESSWGVWSVVWLREAVAKNSLKLMGGKGPLKVVLPGRSHNPKEA